MEKQMLVKLHEIEKILPELLRDSTKWNSLYIDYEVPHVERVWTQVGEYRVCLHRIHSCEKPYFHKHPWPSAMRIVKGTYRMSVSYGKGSRVPPAGATIILPPDSTYEMVEPDGWHSVNPVGEPVMSVMVIGKPWKLNAPKSGLELKPLDKISKEQILNFFGNIYK